MSDTRTGRIYKIVCSKSNDVYVGSTFNALRKRMTNHKSFFCKKKGIAIYESFELHGWESLKIILISEYQVVDRHHLETYEQLWINKLKAVNKNMPFHLSPILKNRKKIYKCPCGGRYRYYGFVGHCRSGLHQKWLQSRK